MEQRLPPAFGQRFIRTLYCFFLILMFMVSSGSMNPVSAQTASFTATSTTGNCSPATFNFTDTSIGATSWFWDFGDSNTDTTQNTTENYIRPGIYTVTLTINGKGNNGISTTQTVNVYPAPNPTIPSTVQGCEPFTGSLTAVSTPVTIAPFKINSSNVGGITGGAVISYTWDFSGALVTQITSTPVCNLTNVPAGTYNVLLTVTDENGCSNSISVPSVLTISPLPAVNDINTATCSGSSFSVTPLNGTNGVVPSGTIYSWNSPTGSGFTGGSASSGSPTSISGSLVNSTDSPVLATYSVTPTVNNCSGPPFNVQVTVNPTGQITNPGNQLVCNNSGTAAITFSTTRTGGLTTYTWTNDTPGIGLAANSGGTSTGIPSFTATNNGPSPITATITVTPTFTNGSVGCPGTSQSFTIKVDPTPTVIATPTQQTLCSGSTTGIGLSTAITGATVTYSWAASLTSGTASGFSSGSGSTIAQALTNTSNSTAVVRYTVTPIIGTCSGTPITVDITVNPTPTVIATPTQQTLCSGATTGIGLSSAITGATVTYSWTAALTSGTASGFSNSNGSTIAQALTNTSNSPAVVRYTVTPTIGTCSGTPIAVDITANPTGQVTNPGNQVVFNNTNTSAIVFSTTRTGGTTTYTWINDTPSIGLAASSGGASTGIPSFTAINNGTSPITGTITVTPTFTGGTVGCTGTAQSFTITVNPTGQMTNPGNQVVCNNSGTAAIVFSTGVTGGVTTYTWTNDTPGIGLAAGSGGNSTGIPSFTAINTGTSPLVATITVTPTFTSGGNSVTGIAQSFTITVNPTSQVTNPGNQVVCNNSSTSTIVFATTRTGGLTTYTWTNDTPSIGLAASSGGTSTGIPSFTATNSGTSPITAIITITPTFTNGSVGCPGTSQSFTIKVDPTPTVIATPTQQTLCSGATTGIGLSSAITGVTVIYSWAAALITGTASGFSNGSGSSIAQTLTNTTNSPAVVRYTVTPTIGTCSGTPITVDITVNPTPTVIATPTQQTLCSGLATGIGLSTAITGATVTYSWTAALTSGTASGFSNSNGSTIAQALTNTSNSPIVVRYTVIPTIGTCSGTPITVDITVNPAGQVTNPGNQVVFNNTNTSAIVFSTARTGGTTTYTWINDNPSIGLAANSGGASTGIPSFTAINNGTSPITGTITVTPTFTGGTVGCTGTAQIFTITVNPTGQMTNPGNQVVCNNSGTAAIVFSTGVTGGVTTYTWTNDTPGIGLAAGSGGNSTGIPSFTAINTGTSPLVATITVTPTFTSGGNSVTGIAQSFTITVNPTSQVTNPGNQVVCNNSGTAAITFSTTRIGGVTTYSWTNDTPSIGLSASSGGTSTGIPSFTATNSGTSPITATITVTPTFTNGSVGCPGTSQSFTIKVDPTSIVIATPTQQTLCSGSTTGIGLSTAITGATVTYSWTASLTSGTASGFSNGSGSTIAQALTNTSNSMAVVRYTVTPTIGTCSGTPVTVDITVNPTPTVIATPIQQTLCSGATTGIGLSTAINGATVTYSWTASLINGTASGFSNSNGSTIAQALTNTSNSPAVVRYTVIPTIGTCSGTPITVDITVNPAGQVTNPGNQVVFNNTNTSAIVFSTARTGGTTTYTWINDNPSIGLAANSGGASTGIPSFTAINNGTSPITGTITVTPTFTGGTVGCAGTAQSFTITVNPTGQMTNPGNQVVCNNSGTAAIVFSTGVTGGVTTYTWTNDTPGIGLAAGSGGNSTGIPSFTAINTGTSPLVATITVTPTFTSGGNSVTGIAQSFTITVNPTSQVTNPGNQVVCNNSGTAAITFSTTRTGGLTTYTWTNDTPSIGLAANSGGTSTGTPSFTATNNGTSPITATISVTPTFTNGSVGCAGTSQSFTITVNPTSQVTNPGNQVVCNNSVTSTIVFATTRTGGITTYTWTNDTPSTGLAASSGGTSTGIPSFTATNNGTSPVTATITVTPTFTNETVGCNGISPSFTITVNPTPTVIATPNQQTICSGSTTGIGLSTAITGATVTYSWTAALISGNATGFSNGSGISISQALTNNTNSPAVVRYTVIPSIGGCSGTPISVDITVNPTGQVVTPVNQVICNSTVTASIVFATTRTGGVTTYTWTNDTPGIGLPASSGGTTTGVPVFTAINNGTSPVTATIAITPTYTNGSAGCAGSSQSFTITVNPTGQVTNPGNQLVCRNSGTTAIVFATTRTGGITTYTWTNDTPGIGLATSSGGTSTGIPSFTAINNGTFPLTATITVTPTFTNGVVGCAGTSQSFTITVNPTPTVIATPNQQTICSGSTMRIGLSTGITGAAVTYSWTAALISGTATGFSNGSGSSIAQALTNNTNSPAVVRYTVIPSIGTCSGTPVTIDITVNPTPTVVVLPAQQTICSGSSTGIGLSTTSTGTAVTYSWTARLTSGIASGFSNDSGGSIAQLLTNNTNSPAVVRYTVTPFIGTCSGIPITVDITINPLPSPVNDFKILKAGESLSDNVLTNDGLSLTVKQFVLNGINYQAGNIATINGIGTLRMTAVGDYVFTPVPGFVGGVPAITYTVSNASGCTATASLTITVNTLVNPVQDSGVIPATGGTVINNVASNDLVNGLSAALGTGGNSTISQSGIWPSGITLVPTTGGINVARGTSPGTYSVTYQLCDELTPSTCGLMVDQITVTPVITPVTESGTISAIGGNVIANVAANDIVNGLQAVLGVGGNAVVSQSGIWPSGISLDPATGSIKVAKGVSQGTYNVSYQICDLLTPQTCAVMLDQVTVTTVIIPVSESGIIPSTGGVVISNIVDNDIVNGLPAVLGTGRNCSVSQSGNWPAGITLDQASGAIHVAQGTIPGTYSITYQLCDLLTPQTCALMTDQVTITPVITALTENGTIPATGGIAISTVVGNDLLNGLPAQIGSGGNCIVSQYGVWPKGITLDPATGSINVAKGTIPATYPVIYQLCDLLTPQTCALMVDQIIVTPQITPVTENGSIAATGGVVLTNIAGNDLVNGLQAILGTLANCTISRSGVWPTGITLDPITGNISVTKGTLPGTYSVTYQLCDLLTPQTCALMTDQVTVASFINPLTESGTIPATGGIAIANVTGNDVLNGIPAVLGTGGNCTISRIGTWPTGITLDQLTGNISVTAGTSPGTYSVSYQLCDILTPQSCATIVDQVVVTPLLTPVKENGTASATGGIAITNISGNDMVNGHPALLGTGGNCTITTNGTWPAGVTLDPKTGNIIVANGTVPGTYSVSYQLCDLLIPQTCTLMVDQVIVTPLISLKTQTGSIQADGGIVITNVVINDVVNGRPALLGPGGNCTISQNGSWPVGVSLDTNSGTINVVSGTTAGTYTVTYQLCDDLVPQTCALMVDQITVKALCDLSIVKTVDNSTPITGNKVVFTLTATNKGPSKATAVKVNDLLPAGYTFVSDNSGGSYASGTGIWSIGNLAKGAIEVLNITVLVNNTGSYSNTATISGLENDPSLGNNTSTNTPVPFLRNLKPVAVDDSTSVDENNTVSFNVMTNDIPSIKGGNVWKLSTNPTHGIITFYPDGTFTYVPDMNFYGIDTFTYTLTNVSGDSSTAKVTIAVLATPKVALIASKPIMNNDGTFRWKYTLTIFNNTNLTIDSIQVTDNLEEVFNGKGCSFEVTGITASGSLLSNGLYNGSSVINLLIDGKSMAKSAQDSILFEINVNTHGQQDTISVFNQALFTASSTLRKFSIYSDAYLTTRQLEATQTNIPAVDLFIPEGFSPNNDSYNDKFVITHSVAVKVDFEVFNRWGNSVYKSSDYQNDWDGKGTGNFLGKDLPTGTYYCIYSVKNSRTGEITTKGEKYITLRR